jgi:uncharacterized membrane protein YraQ (UPF0718 family)
MNEKNLGNSKVYRFQSAVRKAAKSFLSSLPVLLGVIGVIGLIKSLIPISSYSVLFGRHWFIDSVTGALLGSILAGNPITSYIIGGEMSKQGISFIAITSFIVAWVTVGVVQLPAEIMLLGKRFAITRTLVSFTFAIVISMITVATLRIL